jgi:anaerobic selenocysteine-containing dehydrogenase
MITRRVQNTTNASYRVEGLLKQPYNPAYLHSSDLARLELLPGDRVEIRSRHGTIVGFVDRDDHLRPGVVSMCHGFGGYPGDPEDPDRNGSNINRLLSWNDDFDPYHGMPRMSALPVAIVKATESMRMSG